MEEISLSAQELFKIGRFSVTNSLFLTLAASLLLISFSFLVQRKVSMVPGRLQSFAEMGMEKLIDVMKSTLGSAEKAERYFPLVATIFIFIMAANLLGAFPGVGSLVLEKGARHVPLFRPPAADLNFTLAFAVVSVIAANVLGMMAVGVFHHTGKFLNFTNPIAFFIGIMELVSEVAKVISLSFRLFGNVFAGEVLLTIISFLTPYFIPLPFLFLEVFVGLIQAFVFAMLTLVSIALHTAGHE